MAQKVYDSEQTENDRVANASARDEIRSLEDQFNEPAIDDKDRNTGAKNNYDSSNSDARARKQQRIADRQAAGGSIGKQEAAAANDTDQKQQDNFLKKAREKFKGLSNRKKAAFGIGGGAIGGVLVFASLLTSTYRIPSLLGGIDNDQNSSRIVRLIVERRFKRILAEYQIRTALGPAARANYYREGSMMDKLYKSFDAIKLNKVIEQENGIKFVYQNNHVHVFHYGKDIGIADDFAGYKALEKTDKQFAKASKRIVTHTIPIARYSFSSTLRRWIINRYGVRFRPPKWDKKLTREQNLEKMRLWQIQQTTEGPLSMVRSALLCALESDCDPWKEFDKNKPVDTATESPGGRAATVDPKDSDAQAVSDEIDKAAKTTEGQVAKTGESYYAKFLANLTETFSKILTSRLTADLVPIVGQINLMAELDHLAWTINENKIGQKLPIFLKEQAYASMSAVWRAFGDNMKLGDLDIEQVNVLNASVIGVEGAATYNYLFKGVATVGEVVDPRIDSNVDNSLASAQDFIYKKTGRRISHEILNIWYQTVSRPLNALEDWGFGLLFKFIGALGAFALFTNAMSAMFGENWQEDLAKWSADSLMQILGLVVDPLATGAQLFNNLYVGGDVIMNKYCQTNLGCMALSTAIKSGIFGTNQMLQEDRELYNSSLSIQERLFSFDEPGSLANAVVREMPDTMSPGSTFGVIVSQVTQLPTRLLGVMTGRAFAAETPNQDAAVDGVEQFGVSTDAQLDRDVNSKVREEADPVCPDNDKSKINECQTDKEVMTVAFCHSTNCPQFVESSSAPIEAPDTGTGPVATTGDIKALAAKLLALHDSGQIKMNPEVVQDLTKTKNGDPIGSCGVQDLDAALLNLLIRIASKYKFTMWNIVTGHGCNYAPHHFHPKGMASDIGAVNGEAANLGGGFRPLMDATLAREFALFVAGSMPKGRGGMGQSDCTVLVPVNNWPAGVEMFTGDGCNHFHVDVGDYSS